VALIAWGSGAGGARPSRAVTLPKEFFGGFTDIERQSTWSQPSTTTFSGYDAEFAFKTSRSD
jgi:hypothetical protein